MSADNPETGQGGNLLAEVFDLLDDPLLMVGKGGRITGWNLAALRLMEVESALEPVADSAPMQAMAAFLSMVEGPFVMPLPAPDGERYYRVGTRVVRGRPGRGVLVQFQDVTETVRAERALRQSEARFRTLTSIAGDAIVMTDTQGRIRVWNAAAERIFGWSPAEALGISLQRLLQPADGGHTLVDLADTGEAQSDHTHALSARRRDGRQLQVELSFSRAPLASGWGALAILRDVSARFEAEMRLRQAEERWQFALEGGGDGVWDWNLKTGQVFFSPRLAAMLGYGLDEFGQDADAVRKRVHPDDQSRIDAGLRRHFSGETETFICDFRMVHKDGDYLWVHSRGRLIERDANGEPLRMVGTHRDITHARQADEALQTQLAETQRLNRRLEEAQSQLIQSEKMASLGQLSAGIAHELNTPVAFVGSNLGSLERYFLDLMELVAAYEYAERAAPPQEPSFAAVRQARAQCELDYMKEDMPALFAETRSGLESVGKIVRDLNEFSEAGHEDYRHADLNRGLDATLQLLAKELGSSIQVERHYENLPEAWCQPSAINQVFLNIVRNAIQSMAGQGRIGINTRREGDNAVVEISDTGPGIPQEIMGRIFEPFFTTKPVGQGTGLGLSLAYGIVKKHRGHIEVDSQPGHGSTFRIVLPLTADSRTLEV